MSERMRGIFVQDVAFGRRGREGEGGGQGGRERNGRVMGMDIEGSKGERRGKEGDI
jgi:hypothetical protein